MTYTARQYYLDKDQKVDIRIDCWSHGKMHVIIYNDRNDTSVGYTCNKDELRGLADFIYDLVGKNQ